MIIYIIITILLESFLKMKLPYFYNDLLLITPMLIITSLIFIFLIFKQEKSFIITIIMGFIYDLLFTNKLLINIFLFILVREFIKYFFNNFRINLKSLVICNIIIIIIYEVLFYFLLVISGYVININMLLYKIYNSFLINVIYTIISYLILSKFYPLKRK